MLEILLHTKDFIRMFEDTDKLVKGIGFFETPVDIKFLFVAQCPHLFTRMEKFPNRPVELVNYSYDKTNWQPLIKGSIIEIPEANKIYFRLNYEAISYLHMNQRRGGTNIVSADGIINFQIRLYAMDKHEIKNANFLTLTSDGFIPLYSGKYISKAELSDDDDSGAYTVLDNEVCDEYWTPLKCLITPNYDIVEFTQQYYMSVIRSDTSATYTNAPDNRFMNYAYNLIPKFESIMLIPYRNMFDLYSFNETGWNPKGFGGVWADFEYPTQRAILDVGAGLYWVLVKANSNYTQSFVISGDSGSMIGENIPPPPPGTELNITVGWGMIWRSKQMGVAMLTPSTK